MKQYPTILVLSPEIQHLKATPCPDSFSQLSSGVINISHMAGAALFPLPSPWGGGGVGG